MYANNKYSSFKGGINIVELDKHINSNKLAASASLRWEVSSGMGVEATDNGGHLGSRQYRHMPSGDHQRSSLEEAASQSAEEVKVSLHAVLLVCGDVLPGSAPQAARSSHSRLHVPPVEFSVCAPVRH